jgi:hypothetical protein
VIPALEAYLQSAPRDGQKDAARQAIESIRARAAATGATGGLPASGSFAAPVPVSPHTSTPPAATPSAARSDPSDGVRVTVPPLNELRWISLTTGGWILDIRPDGSGTVGYGSSAGDFAKDPAGTFDFAEAYKKMVLVVQPTGSTPPFYAVCFHKEGETSASAVYTKDGAMVLALFEKALAARDTKAADRLDEIRKTNPIIKNSLSSAASAVPLAEADKAAIEKEIAATFDQAVKEHNAAAQQLADVKPGADVNPRDAKDFIPWGLGFGSDLVGEVCLNRSEALATLFRRLGDPTSAAARPSPGDPAYADRRLAYAEAAGRFLTHKDPKYVAVACEFLAHLPAEAVDAGLVPALAGLLGRRDAAFEGATRGVTQQSVSLSRLAGGVTVGTLADAALAEMTSFHFADERTFQAWWDRNQDYRNRLWYWSLRWRGVQRETADYARADVAALPPAQALRFMLLAGNAYAKLADAGVPADAALGRLGTGPILEQRRYAPSFHGSIIADLVQRNGLKNDLMAVVRQAPPWPEAKGKEALRALFLSDDGSTTVLPIMMQPGLRASFDKADVDAIVKEVEDARGLLSNDQLLNQFVETVLMLDPSRAEGLCVSLLKRNPKQPLIAARLVRYSALQHWDLVQAACPPGADRRPVVEALGDLRTPEAAAILLRWMNEQDWTPKLNNLGYESDPAMGYLRESFVKAANAMNRGKPAIAQDLLDRATWRGSKISPEELKVANKDVPAAQAELVAALKKFLTEAAGPAANEKVR